MSLLASPKPRIALVHYTAPPVPGGVERVMDGQTKTFLEAGWEVHWIVGAGGNRSDEASTLLSQDHVILIPELSASCPCVQKLNHRLLQETEEGQVQANTLEEFERLKDSLASRLVPHLNRMDVVLIHNLLTMPFHPVANAVLRDWVQGLPVQKASPRVVAWTHDLGALDARYQKWHALASLMGAPFDAFHKDLPGIHWAAVSDYQRQRMSTLFQWNEPHPRAHTIQNALNLLDEISASERLQHWLKRLDWEARSLILFHPARLIPRKNVSFSLEVLQSLREVDHPATKNMLLVGSGAGDFHLPESILEREKLRQLSKQWGLDAHVAFVGDDFELTDEEVRALYRLADLVMFPSLSEGFGLPLIESAAHGKPVFYLDIPPLNELAHSMANAYGVDATADEVARLILEWIDSPFGKNAIKSKELLLHRVTWKTHLTLASQLLNDSLP